MNKHNNSKDDIVRGLNELFGNVLHIEIIKSVASTCNYDVNKSSNVLLELSSNIADTPKRAKSKPNKKTESTKSSTKSRKELEINRVRSLIQKGYKVLILLRGLPGSGKSYLAHQLLENLINPSNFPLHILSTDDFFCNNLNKEYLYDPNKLQQAHGWNHSRAFQAMSRGLSPVIIDNTNVQMWEMKPYAMMATDYSYLIEILEPTTWWFNNDKELTKRCVHNVPKIKIKDMLERYEKNVTTQKLLMAYSLSYKFKKPPQMRLVPPINQDLIEFASSDNSGANKVTLDEFSIDSNRKPIVSNKFAMNSNENGNNDIFDDLITFENYLKPEKPKLDKLFSDVENAWGIDEKALQSWDIVKPIESVTLNFEITTETEIEPIMKDSETNTDSLDFDALNVENFNLGNVKIIMSKSRDINYGCVPKIAKIPKKLKLDKSCLTDDDILENSNGNCIETLINMFPTIPKTYLMDIYEKCERKFNWTIDVLLADNNCIDYKEPKPSENNIETTEQEEILPEVEQIAIPRHFRHKQISDESKELKKCLESKFDINKQHYSDHVLKVKQFKFGEPSTSQNCDSDSDLEETDEDPNNLLELNLGENFVEQLELKFGDPTMIYPKGFQPVVQIPTDLARQLYTFYLESVYQQMEAQNEILSDLVREDEEFARKLQEQENFSNKTIGQWENLNAESLAEKLTKSKLFHLFPEIERNCLLEIYKAYNGNFQETVKILQNSRPDLEINNQEVPIIEETVKDMKEAEKNNYFDEVDELSAVQYRKEANKYLEKRVELYQKAQNYYQKGMTEVAQFYSELAKQQTKYYDRANNVAATKFLDENSKRLQKYDTIDLHFLYVKEALSALDLFIDRNINLLKIGQTNGKLFIITGRGRNSEGGVSRIKPAVVTRLRKRNLSFVQLNPGLLQIKIKHYSPMTADLD